MEPWEKYTKHQLVIIIKQYEARLDNMRKNLEDLRLEAEREKAAFVNAQKALQIDHPWESVRQQKLTSFIHILIDAIRDYIGLSGRKNVFRNWAYGLTLDGKVGSVPAKKVALSKVIMEIQDYFDWDDE